MISSCTKLCRPGVIALKGPNQKFKSLSCVVRPCLPSPSTTNQPTNQICYFTSSMLSILLSLRWFWVICQNKLFFRCYLIAEFSQVHFSCFFWPPSQSSLMCLQFLSFRLYLNFRNKSCSPDLAMFGAGPTGRLHWKDIRWLVNFLSDKSSNTVLTKELSILRWDAHFGM